MKMFRANRDLHDSIEACRSRYAQLPDGRIIGPLEKFASMGSALCFPVEAMYFYTILVLARLDYMNLSYTPGNVYNVTRDVYVYGDDIIIPVDGADVALDYLRKYNCKVNSNKTFLNGQFRESCGVDAFGGYEVTPTYITKMRPESKRQASEIISWVAASNHFYKKGYWNTTRLIRKWIERLIGPMPYVTERSSVLGHISFLNFHQWYGNLLEVPSRWNGDYHRLEIQALAPSPVYRTDVLEGYGALSKCLKNLSLGFDLDKILLWDSDLGYFRLKEWRKPKNPKGFFALASLHTDLCKSALHGAVTLKRRWVATEM
jgi:hypothetical protein